MTGHYNQIQPLGDSRLAHAGIKNPFVTVIVTSYNYERYIIDCLKSIAGQSYDNFNCIVVDDCSSDKSVEKIKDFIKSDSAKGKFELVSREKNSGQMAAFKTGLQNVEGPFVVLVDADDILLNDFLETHIRLHLGRYTVAFTSSNQYQINENGEIIGGNHHDLQCQGEFRHIYHRALHKPFWVWATTSSMMFRKSILDLIMTDNMDDLKICADNYIVHFANLLGGSLLIPSAHGCYRRHGNNGFGSNPVIGGHLPVGNMDKHPKHEVVRKMILNHLLKSYSSLHPLFSTSGYLNLIMRTATLQEVVKLKSEYPHIFPKRELHYIKEYIEHHIKNRYLRSKFLVRQRLASNAFA